MPKPVPLPPLEAVQKQFKMVGSTMIDLRTGKEAGTLSNGGYGYVTVKRHGRYKVSRLAYLLHHGVDPGVDTVVDHEDHDRSNNAEWNLRACTNADNMRNQSLSVKNKVGHVGVRRDPKNGRWVAFGHIGKKFVHISQHATMEEAAAASKQWRLDHGYHPMHGE